MTHCPTCHTKLIRSTTMVEGVVVLACRPCQKFTVEGVDVWCDPGVGLRDTLKRMAQQRDHGIAMHKEIMESPITDPRWTKLSI